MTQLFMDGPLGTHFDLWNGSGFQELLTLPFVPPATEAQQQPVGGGTALSQKAASQETAPTPPSGPAAQAILQWFTTDRSLGCMNQQGKDSACAVGLNMQYGGVDVYYGDSTGDGPQADALAFVYYDGDPTANGTNLAIAYFHRDGGNYRFIKTFPGITGDLMQSTPDVIVKGRTVRFLPGEARFSMVVHRDTDALCCPTGRANYTITLNPALPATGNTQTNLYHAPQTPAELALDNVININIAGPNNEPSLSNLMAVNALPPQYAALFTPALILAVFNANTAAAQGCFVNPPPLHYCTLDIDPIDCTTDIPPTPILYRTISDNGSAATVAYEWGADTTYNIPPTGTDQGRYRLVKVDGTWKLDGIECPAEIPGAAGYKFNMSQQEPVGGGAALSHQAASQETPPGISPALTEAPGIAAAAETCNAAINALIAVAGRHFWGDGVNAATSCTPYIQAALNISPAAGQAVGADVNFAFTHDVTAYQIVTCYHVSAAFRDSVCTDAATHAEQSATPELVAEAQAVVAAVTPYVAPLGSVPSAAALPPEISLGQIQSWKDYIKDYPQRLAEYQQDQAARRKEAEEVDFSKVKPEDIKKYYPLLSDSDDIAESRGKINLLFVISTELSSWVLCHE